MTDIAIEQQVKSIQKATKKAAQSREAARKFLTEAGIIAAQNPASTTVELKKKK